jgi:hypothetical protein
MIRNDEVTASSRVSRLTTSLSNEAPWRVMRLLSWWHLGLPRLSSLLIVMSPKRRQCDSNGLMNDFEMMRSQYRHVSRSVMARNEAVVMVW